MKNNFKALFLLPVLAIVSTVFISSCGDDTPTPPDPEPSEYTIKDDGNGTGTTTWKEGKTYILDG
ncbi:MAG TPA: hypothetical protein ENK91_08610, partial [Bacteroidetes bacterium]|nr:hypothetical protein [Bacteroidota bacterium]